MISIDIKYQIWKFGVVFTDGVRNFLNWYPGHVLYSTKLKHCFCRLSCICAGTWWCLCLAITTTSSLPVTFWTLPWESRLFVQSCLLSLTMANRQAGTDISHPIFCLCILILHLSVCSSWWQWGCWLWWCTFTLWLLSISSASFTTKARMRMSPTWNVTTWWPYVQAFSYLHPLPENV